MIRLFDIFFSLLFVIFFSPFFILIMLILKFTGEGKIFYFQDRIGKNQKIIKICKFVTMKEDSPNIGTKTITTKNDPRVLPFGIFLRKSKINELPQLFNIIHGSMSIVGPRPLTAETFYLYSNTEVNIISQLKPGLTGISSLIFRNEENLISNSNNGVDFYNLIICPYKAKLEQWFYSKNSIMIYFIIIFLTFIAIFFPNLKLHWLFFPSLPKPSNDLIGLI